MNRPWILELKDGSHIGPWICGKGQARKNALRALGRGKLPRGSTIREWNGPARKPAPSKSNGSAPARIENGRVARLCEDCGKGGALLVGRVGRRECRNLCAECDA